MADDKRTETVPLSEPEAHAMPPGIQDKRKLPEGVVPKQAQGYVMAGLAVLILLAVMFSKNHAKPAEKNPAPTVTAVASDLNQRKIQELEQDLGEDQRQIAQQAAATHADSPSTAANAPMTVNPAQPSSPMPSAAPPQSTEAPRDPIADAERALAFKARFASNLTSAEDHDGRSLFDDASQPAHPPSSSETSATQTVSTAASPSANKRAPEVNANAAHGQPYVVFEGTTIDTVLVNRLDGEFAGPLKVMVTNPVYSRDRQHLLIPEGTFILGGVEKVSGVGQKRLAVTFHRMLMPDGYSVDLDQFHGLDQGGATGLKDQLNNHYLEIFGASIALGIIAGAAESTNLNQGYNESGSEAYRSGIASSLSQSSSNVLDRFANIPPTITIREGHRIKVYITQDMLLPAYENHDMPSAM